MGESWNLLRVDFLDGRHDWLVLVVVFDQEISGTGGFFSNGWLYRLRVDAAMAGEDIGCVYWASVESCAERR